MLCSVSMLLIANAVTYTPPPFLQRDAETTRMAGWGYVRMHNTKALTMLGNNMSGERGEAIKQALHPGGSRMSYKKISIPLVRKITDRDAYRNFRNDWNKFTDPIKIEASLNLGSGYKGGTQPNAVYHGVATKDGNLNIGKIDQGPFYVSKVKTYTGYWTNGVPDVGAEKSGTGDPISIPVKAGQAYEITCNMYTKTEGTYSDDLILSDGALTNIKLSGTVKSVDNLQFSAAWEGGSFTFTPGFSYTRNIRVLVGGTEPVKVRVRAASSYSGFSKPIQVSTVEKTIQPNVPTSIPLSMVCKATADDQWNHAIPIEVTAYNGQKEINTTANIHIETLWAVHHMTKTLMGLNSTFQTTSTFSVCSNGEWFLDIDMDTHGNVFLGWFVLEGSGKKPGIRFRDARNQDFDTGGGAGAWNGWHSDFHDAFTTPSSVKMKVTAVCQDDPPTNLPAGVKMIRDLNFSTPN